MKPSGAILRLFLLIILTTFLEFLWPAAQNFVAPILVLILGYDFWKSDKIRYLLWAAIAIIPFPELQAKIIGPLELQHSLLLLAAFLAFFKWFLQKPRPALSDLSKRLIIYFIVLVGVTLINYDSIISWHRLLILVFLFLIALSISQVVKDKTHIQELFYVLIATTLATVLVSFTALYFSALTNTYFENPYLHISVTEGVPRLASTLLDSNFYSHYLLLILPGLLALLIIKWSSLKRFHRLVLLAATLIILATFFLTYSRSGYIGLFVALSIIILSFRLKMIWKTIGILLIAFIVATTLYYPFPFYSIYRTPARIISSQMKDKLMLSFDPQALSKQYIAKVKNNPNLSEEERATLLARDVSSDSLGYRILFWKAGLAMFKEHPLFGVGVGQFRYQFKNYANEEYLKEPDTHNIYIEQLAETGIIGFSMFLLIIYSCISRLYKIIKKKQHNLRIYAVINLASLLGLLAQSALLGGYGAAPLYICIGVTISLSFLDKQIDRQNIA